MEIRKTKVILGGNRRAVLKDEFCRTYNGIKGFTQPQHVVKVMDDVFKLSDQADEYVYIICMTSKGKPIGFFEISHGSQTRALVDAGSILTRVLLCGAPEFIMIHNHPSGDPEPSEDDIMVTRRVMEAAELIGVRMSDHIIIGSDGYFSFNEMKRIFETMKKAQKIQDKEVAE